MADRKSIVAYIEAKAARIRARDDKGDPSPGREHAALLDALASDIVAGLDVADQVAA